MKDFIKFMKLAFSENKIPSSKRVCGGIGIIVSCSCSVALNVAVMARWISYIPDALITTNMGIFFGSCTLLGVSTITNIWKSKGSK